MTLLSHASHQRRSSPALFLFFQYFSKIIGQKLAGTKKKPYLCTRKTERDIKMVP
jgi:hypothetical protein